MYTKEDIIMREQLKKSIRLLGAICISSLLAAGCSSTPAPDAGSQTVSLPSDSTEPAETGTPQYSTDTDTSDTAPAQDDTVSDNAEGKWHVLPPEVAAAVDADFEGIVWRIDDNSFYIAPTETEILEGGILSACGPSPDADLPDTELVSVVFDDSTHFFIRTIHNGGESYEDSDAAFQDIAKEQMVSLKGRFENDVFHATEIRIAKFS